MSSKKRSAFTLVELLVVIAIIGVLMALLLPAVQAAREAAKRSSCENNLKQIGLAFHNYADANKGWPGSRTFSAGSPSNPSRGWVIDLLPFIESEPLRKAYRYDREFYQPENQPVVSTPVSFMQCPSSPDQNRILPLTLTVSGVSNNYGSAAAGDYWVHHRGVRRFDGVTKSVPLSSGPGSSNTLNSLGLVTDGLSQTILVVEMAMKPQKWILGVRQADPTGDVFNGAAAPGWAYCVSTPPSVFSADGLTSWGVVGAGTATESQYPCAVNCNNSGVYAFHPAGANSLFCDGSVHFLSTKLSSNVFLALCSCDGDEIISSGTY